VGAVKMMRFLKMTGLAACQCGSAGATAFSSRNEIASESSSWPGRCRARCPHASDRRAGCRHVPDAPAACGEACSALPARPPESSPASQSSPADSHDPSILDVRFECRDAQRSLMLVDEVHLAIDRYWGTEIQAAGEPRTLVEIRADPHQLPVARSWAVNTFDRASASGSFGAPLSGADTRGKS